MTRIALISAVTAAIPPAAAALSKAIPDAEVWNILDDRLLADANTAGGLTPELRERMEDLIRHALRGGADGVLLTCSLYGEVARTVDAAAPVLAPDDAVFDEIVKAGYLRVGVVASFDGAASDSTERLGQALEAAGRTAAIEPIVVSAALDATKTGDEEALAEALITAVLPERDRFDAILLAQYSLAPARETLAAAVLLPVHAGPQAAADILRATFEE